MIPRRLVLLALGICMGLLGWSASANATIPTAQATSAIIQLTTDPANDLRPAWSPDGRQIAFQSNRDGPYHIYLMNVDGGNQRALTQGAMDDRHPVWTPDGKALLFDSDDGKAHEIWTVNVADGHRKQVTHLGAEASFASPSPDGQHIAFYLFKDQVLDLWTARIDGSDARPLTKGLAIAKNNQCTFACHQAAWNPDGQSIVYSAGELDSIWSVPSNGGNPSSIIDDGEDNHFPWFMADGRLGYITEHISPIQSWTDAWVYDFKGGKPTLLQAQMSPQGPFEWSADNKKVLFHSPRAGSFEIYLIDLTAPGGVQALQGTPVPAQVAFKPSAPVAPTANSAMQAQAIIPNLPIDAVGITVVASAVIAGLGLVVWRRARS